MEITEDDGVLHTYIGYDVFGLFVRKDISQATRMNRSVTQPENECDLGSFSRSK